MSSSVLVANQSTDSDTHSEDHNDEVFRAFKIWNQVPATLLLLTVIVLGGAANMFIIYCIYKKSIGIKYVNPVLLAIAVKNMVAILTCIPFALVMLNYPPFIYRQTCDVQENLTFFIVFAGFLFPALLSIVQCDHVIRPRNQVFTGNRLSVALCLVAGISLLLGLHSKLIEDDHGCHLWSVRTDEVVLSKIYSIVSVFLFTLITVVTSYAIIFFRARTASNSIRIGRKIIPGSEVANEDTSSTPDEKQKKSQEHIKNKRRVTTAILKPMFCIVFSNIITSLPWIILYIFTAYDHTENTLKYAELRVLTMCIMEMPIATDPVIFLGFSTKGRNAVMAFLKKRSIVAPYSERPTVSPGPSVIRTQTSVM